MLLLTICVFICISQTAGQVKGPEDMSSSMKAWAWRLQYKHIYNMTEELVKDATSKIHHAEKIQDEHKGSIGYELGTIAAGILERFLYMLKLYRQYANIKELSKGKIKADDYMSALHNIQGAYHEIQLEKEMFYKLLEKHKNVNQREEREKRMKKMLEGQTNLPPRMDLWVNKPETMAGGGLSPQELDRLPAADGSRDPRKVMQVWRAAEDRFAKLITA